MLITDFVITRLSKNETIKTEVLKTDLILFHINNNSLQFSSTSNQSDHKHNSIRANYIRGYLPEIIKNTNIHSIHFLDKFNYTAFNNTKALNIQKIQKKKKIENEDTNKELIKTYTLQAIDKNQQVFHFFDKTWGIFWKDNKYLSISYPIDQNMGITFIIALDTIYSSYREKQKVILSYILFNTIILCLIALIGFSKIIINPIKKLTNLAKQYDGESDTLYMLYPVKNEFGMLSNSLNSMMDRISEDKQKLKANFDELEKAQTEIIRAEKMSSIGKLSAGIAHEIGNPIGIVLGYLQLLKQNNLSSDKKYDFLNRAETEIQRIDKIIKDLLNLSRKPKTESKIKFQSNSIHEIITETINMLKIQPGFLSIDIKLELNAMNESVISDRDQIKQVFINLILNAVDAIFIKEKERGFIQIATTEAKEKLEIRISDNGVGVACDDLTKIFDPFYTTKEPGSGTGLGLWVSYMIIDEINGNIIADSDQDNGTTFIIKLPLQNK